MFRVRRVMKEFCATLREILDENSCLKAENESLRPKNAEQIMALEEEIDKQKFKFEVLKAHGIEIVDAVGGGHEIYDTRKREVDRLKYENAKLRELVADVHEALCADKAGMFHRLTLASMEDDMRELGIEIDD